MSRLRRFALIGTTVFGFMLTACGPAGPQAVTVDMTNYAFKLTPDSLRAGDVTFTVKNDSTDQIHEFFLVQTDLTPDKLPLTADGRVDEEATGFTVAGSAEDIDAGQSKELKVTLAPGHYVFFCNVATHYTLGMRGELTIAP